MPRDILVSRSPADSRTNRSRQWLFNNPFLVSERKLENAARGLARAAADEQEPLAKDNRLCSSGRQDRSVSGAHDRDRMNRRWQVRRRNDSAALQSGLAAWRSGPETPQTSDNENTPAERLLRFMGRASVSLYT